MSNRQYSADKTAVERFGAPVTIDEHTTFIPVSRRGLRGRPVAVGAFTVTDGATTWTPIVDGGRVALIGVITGLVAATLGSAAVLRQPPWPRLTTVPHAVHKSGIGRQESGG